MISIQNITFGYNKHKVLSNFSLEIKRGGIYGLLGKNGTGKSTLLYLMMGLLRPQKGNVSIDGTSAQLRQPEVLQDMFLVPEEYDLPAIQLQEYVQSLKPFYPRFDEQLLQECLEAFDMTADVNLGALSMGQKKKVYICIALAAGTRYLLMDEPTNGLDILSKSQFRKVVIKGMTEDKTILISTHQVHDVEHLLDHVIIIEPGKVIMNQPLVETDESVNMEELFINALQGRIPEAPAEIPAMEEEAVQADEKPLRKASLWNVARWDLTVNKPYYLRSLLTIVGCICLPVVFSYLLAFMGAGSVISTHALVSSINTIGCVIAVMSMGYMFHNLLTKQGRINELTLPATNMKKFIWHLLLVTIGVQLSIFSGIAVADFIHFVMGKLVLHVDNWNSLLATIYLPGSDFYNIQITGLDHPGRFLYFITMVGLCYLSTFALGNAWKYKYNIPYTIACHIGVWFVGMLFTALMIAFFAEHREMLEALGTWINANPNLLSILVTIGATVVLALIWWLTYHLYTKAQLTSKSNH